MRIVVLKELHAGEDRVAATPDSVKRFCAKGATVAVEAGAGLSSGIDDGAYEAAGASVFGSPEGALEGADVVLKVRCPMTAEQGVDEVAQLPAGSLVVGFLNPHSNPDNIQALAKQRVTSFAVEFLPRISRAQSMDALSSQSNLAGYKAVVDAAAMLPKALPMMMTAAGTVAPAKVLVLGAGVAGLQAIATAKRLGAVVSAFDVRPAVREQVESLGGRFIEVDASGEEAETEGGYAREMGEDYRRLQQELIHDAAAVSDVVITTALIPGRPAPVLLPEATIDNMLPGSVVIDLAVEAGGNCPLSRTGETINRNGVQIVGPRNLPGTLSHDTSALYARNLYAFMEPLIAEGGELRVPWDDPIVAASVVTRDGAVVHESLEDRTNG
ncbi:MAG: Re/Si-specific NAD(P)(+) transhydrogenase subunit alpha [Rhodospirillales bacterium]|nr:Re/Si-specific NAD(P)(+) transhydrogenase subunit alpha [Rhodospirillales bacterium]